MDNINNTVQYDNVLTLEPEDLVHWLNDNFAEDIPTSVSTVDDLKKAGELLGKLANIYSYLSTLALYAKLKTREAKKDKGNKEEIDKAVDRKEIINSYVDMAKFRYTALSRMINVKKQIYDEMNFI